MKSFLSVIFIVSKVMRIKRLFKLASHITSLLRGEFSSLTWNESDIKFNLPFLLTCGNEDLLEVRIPLIRGGVNGK